MPALAIIPTDLMSSAPKSATSPNTGNEGLFASHLKNATDQRTTTPSSPADVAPKQPRNRPAQNGSQGAKKISAAPPSDAPVATTNPDKTVEAAMPQPAPATLTGAAPPDNMPTNPSAAGQQRESAVARLLADLTAGTTAGGPPVARQTIVQPSPPQLADDAAMAMPAASEMPDNPTAPAASVQTAFQTAFGKEAGTAATPIPTARFAAHHAVPGTQQPQGTVVSPADQQTEGQIQTGNTMVFQSKYGQTITVQQEQVAEEIISDSSSRPGSAATPLDTRTIDVNGNYIRSRLPKAPPMPTASEPDENPQVEDNTLQETKQQKPVYATGSMQSAADDDTQKPQSSVGQETPPLLFAHQQQGAGQQPVTIAPPASGAMLLPSGTTVPDTAAVDQMLAYFSANRPLETGTVALRLHPEELGELRMEITVAQDIIRAHIVAQTSQAQEMIHRHLPRLQEALEQQGLHLQQVEVSVAAHNHPGGERFQERNAWQQSSPSTRHASGQSELAQELDETTGGDSATNILSVLV
ncbi:MAG: flagellar hook-length control protein FliK [Desulfobulbus sp.]|nr:flagellar hook-length control protein FliK [Desulfobulbus sp.]